MDVLFTRGAFTCKMGVRFGKGGGAKFLKKGGSADFERGSKKSSFLASIFASILGSILGFILDQKSHIFLIIF